MAPKPQAERIALLEQQLLDHCKVQNGSLNKIWEKLGLIETALADLSTKLIQDRADADTGLSDFKREVDQQMIKRPSWAVALVLAFLTTTVGIQSTVILALMRGLF